MGLHIKNLFLVFFGLLIQNCSSNNNNVQCTPHEYTDFLYSLPGTVSHFEINEAIKCAKTNNKPLLIYFTNHSINREMEEKLVKSKNIIKLIKNEFTFVSLFGDDKYLVKPKYWVVSESGDTLKRLSKINSNFQANTFNYGSQPYFAITNHSLEPLVQSMGYNVNMKEFENFLKSGLSKMKK